RRRRHDQGRTPTRTRHRYGIQRCLRLNGELPASGFGYGDKLPFRRRIAFQTPGAVDLPSVDWVSPPTADLPSILEDLVAGSVVLLPDHSAGMGLALLTRCLKGCRKGGREMVPRRRAVPNRPTKTPGNSG